MGLLVTTGVIAPAHNAPGRSAASMNVTREVRYNPGNEASKRLLLTAFRNLTVSRRNAFCEYQSRAERLMVVPMNGN